MTCAAKASRKALNRRSTTGPKPSNPLRLGTIASADRSASQFRRFGKKDQTSIHPRETSVLPEEHTRDMMAALESSREIGPATPRLRMQYAHRISKRKRARQVGFRARMRTRKGRRVINRKRRKGRNVQIV